MQPPVTVDFIGIGAARSGTTWLTHCLRAHPQLCLSEPKEVRYFNRLALPDELQPGKVDERFKQRFGVWLVKDTDIVTGENGIYALSTVCTHLGCTPDWLEAAQKFKCPCHGSGYYKSGINFEGPTPRPLERFAIKLADDGQIEVDKNSKFQYEKDQWTDPRSFLKL